MGNSENRRIRRRFDELYLFYGCRCAICGQVGSKDELEFAHVKPTPLAPNGRGRGRKERYYDIKNHLDAYRLMHKDCHKGYDDHIAEDDWFDWGEGRIA